MFRLLALSLAVTLATTQVADAQTNLRTQFNQGMAEFNQLVMEQRLGDALQLIRPEVELTDEDIVRIDNQFWENYPKNFVAFGTVRSEALKNGFRQEILAYWDEDYRYFYVYLMSHSTDNGIKLINVDYSREFEKLNSFF
ncbi:hypothetical protein BXY66_1481 [Shimia isoporae]|uniref:DUF3887 domain-containing protein n=1 Tax=Shimia isoporae TaxID=647720 RepID=A0A4R1NM96_9RHOB|nr:hypothetical protein [Shimia isoporae]TCL09434.1 hypothetical protein BXY66_1481 [Shimia isoporae]